MLSTQARVLYTPSGNESALLSLRVGWTVAQVDMAHCIANFRDPILELAEGQTRPLTDDADWNTAAIAQEQHIELFERKIGVCENDSLNTRKTALPFLGI